MTSPQPPTDAILTHLACAMASFTQGYGGEAKSELSRLVNQLKTGQPAHPLARRWCDVLFQCIAWHSLSLNQGDDSHRVNLGRALWELYQSVQAEDPAPLAQLVPAAEGGLRYLPTVTTVPYEVPVVPAGVPAPNRRDSPHLWEPRKGRSPP